MPPKKIIHILLFLSICSAETYYLLYSHHGIINYHKQKKEIAEQQDAIRQREIDIETLKKHNQDGFELALTM